MSVNFVELAISQGRKTARTIVRGLLRVFSVSRYRRLGSLLLRSRVFRAVNGSDDDVIHSDVAEVDLQSQSVTRRLLIECREKFSKCEYADVARAVLDSDRSEQGSDRRSAALFQARLLCFDSLFADGNSQEAISYLDFVESTYGKSWWTYTRRANLGLFFKDKGDALDAVHKAFLCVPVGGHSNSAYQKTVKLKMALLCQLERYDDAWDFFLRACDHSDTSRPLGASLIAALRRTVVTEGRLREFRMLLLPYFAFRGKRALSALFHYSIAARDLGDYDEALRAIERRLIVGTSLTTFGEKASNGNADWAILARTALLDLRHELRAAGIEFFLISGTLLGCVREGDVLAHDKDFDVGVMSSVSAEDVKQALEDSGRFTVIPGARDKIVRVKHANGVLGDIFRHWEEDGRILHEGQKTRWWNSQFSLRETTFLGEDFQIPEDPDRYLTENYGNWRTPEVDFETFCDTPNMILAEKEELLWYYYRVLLDYYQAGSIAKIQKVIGRLETLVCPARELEVVLEKLKRLA